MWRSDPPRPVPLLCPVRSGDPTGPGTAFGGAAGSGDGAGLSRERSGERRPGPGPSGRIPGGGGDRPDPARGGAVLPGGGPAAALLLQQLRSRLHFGCSGEHRLWQRDHRHFSVNGPYSGRSDCRDGPAGRGSALPGQPPPERDVSHARRRTAASGGEAGPEFLPPGLRLRGTVQHRHRSAPGSPLAVRRLRLSPLPSPVGGAGAVQRGLLSGAMGAVASGSGRLCLSAGLGRVLRPLSDRCSAGGLRSPAGAVPGGQAAPGGQSLPGWHWRGHG